jgi:hypothetical protein
VIGIWGFGVPRRPGTPEEVASLIRTLREDGIDGVTFTALGEVTDRFRHLSEHGADAAAWNRTGPRRAASAADARTIYTAMFDEVDEATAIFKPVPNSMNVPADLPAVTRDEDGCDLPSDHFLRLAGEATQNLRDAAGVK